MLSEVRIELLCILNSRIEENLMQAIDLEIINLGV